MKNNNKIKAIIINGEGKKVKTITGTTNINGYFWNQFNKYANNKGYKTEVMGDYEGSMAWSNGQDILQLKWIK